MPALPWTGDNISQARAQPNLTRTLAKLEAAGLTTMQTSGLPPITDLQATRVGREKMLGSLEETLAEVGYAKVIVALKPTLTAANSRAALEKHFVIPSERQMESLMAVASRCASRKPGHPRPLEEQKLKLYPNLRLALGFVDRGGAAALAASRQVERVVEAPELSLIRPFAKRAARLSAAPTWGIKRLKVIKLWAQGLKGRGASLAIWIQASTAATLH